MRILAILLIIMAQCLCHAVDMEKVRELKELGFSNDQILEMLQSDQPQRVGEPAVRTQSSSNQQSQEQLANFRKLHAQGKGVVIVMASKEYIQRGPGFLEFHGPNESGRIVSLGRVNVLDYEADASRGMVVSKHIDLQSKWLQDYTVSRHEEGVISRYYGEFELPAGTYELKLQRNLHSDRNVSQQPKLMTVSVLRHKKFHDVEVVPGKVTVLSYMWTDNDRFGLDHVMSRSHRDFVKAIESQYGRLIHKVKVQNNE